MPVFSRRSFIAGLSTIPFALWFEKFGAAQAPLTRFNLNTPQGTAMLNVYANAVQTMMNTPEPNPVGWLFQWYTHNVRGDRTKPAEITRIYPVAGPQKTLAQQMWNTCQAHHPGDIEDFFLPWHRMYVFFLERIVRKVSGNAGFTLPYWDYTNSSVPSGPRMPTRFINPAATTNPLFRVNRKTLVKNGNPIDQNNQGSLNLNPLKQCHYSQVGAVQGFNLSLDANLHGTVHVLIGNSLGMGNPDWAGNDPIFWMHHCNIDRLWASWNAAGRQNPATSAWLSKQFVFADENGLRVVATVKDFKAIAPLGYKYDSLAPVPTCPPGVQAEGPPKTRARVTSSVQLGSQPVSVNLQAPPSTAAGLGDLVQMVRNLGPTRRLFLVIRNLSTAAQPGALFNIFLEMPANPAATADDTHKVGSIHFFDAMKPGGHGPMAASAQQKFFSFDITDLAKRLAAEGRLTTTPRLTIAPSNELETDARPVVGEITLIEQ
jgi:tyrosinase